ncbi:phosphatidylethanolamine-binding protein [Dipodascopsis tothii]|uniref:phosphatidylethanolamine-binding protein n=1 Tax=Dipodascopsis tothii TaxID=44089 RepID=UPI0034CD1167
MQRLETMHVIPDTLPTLDPVVDVRLRFPHGPHVRWLTPGSIVSTAVSAHEPEFAIRSFDAGKRSYTIAIVDPDVPDVDSNSYTTALHYLLTDVVLDCTEEAVDKAAARVLVPYVPPVPEKNTGNHRLAVWVFEQRGPALPADLDPAEFDLRSLVKTFRLRPVGAHLWRNKYDSKTDEVRAAHNLGPGRVFSRLRY